MLQQVAREYLTQHMCRLLYILFVLPQMLTDATEGSERRNNRVSMAIEQTAEARLLLGFFETGLLLPPSAVTYCNDDEYLSASLNMAQDLGRYCVNRACEVRLFCFVANSVF